MLAHVFAKIGKRVYAFFMKLAHKNGNMTRNMSKLCNACLMLIEINAET